jgi:hypothetical protein
MCVDNERRKHSGYDEKNGESKGNVSDNNSHGAEAARH